MNWLKSLFSPKSNPEPPRSSVETSPPLGASVTTSDRYPNAFKLPRGGGPDFFDPALRNYGFGFREGDPTFADDAQRRRWYAARQAVLEHLLRVVSASEWRDRLILRGSALLKLWLGDEARMPGDVDWIVLPKECGARSVEARAMLASIAQIATVAGRVGEVMLDPAQVATDEIWTYERADGLRLTFSWHVPDLPPGKVQADFVFGEMPWEPPAMMAVPMADGATVPLLAATPEQSLAWKLLWLLTDSYPQGKDLYDAVMLAERHPMTPDLTERLVATVLEGQGEYWRKRLNEEGIDELLAHVLGDTDWKTFVREYPWAEDDLPGWLDRLKKAIPELWQRETWVGQAS